MATARGTGQRAATAATAPGDIGTVAVSDTRGTMASTPMDWGAVVAGTVLASAISLVLLTFGTAIGLSIVSPFEGRGAGGTVFVIALGLWVLWVVVSSFMAGGYLAGRMRRRADDAPTAHEVEMRDGAHGLTVWALGILLAAFLGAAGISGAVRGGASVAGAVASAGTGQGSGGEAFGYVVDSLFRTADPRGEPAAAESARRQVTRIFVRSAAQGEIPEADRAYITRLVAERTGLEPAEAKQRVETVLAEAKQAAETARKTGVWTGFLAAAALLVGAAAAWWGASTGGRHRDEGTDFSRFMRWR